jgi:2-oxoglutarate/2-oxoacid ferredoxin oxidoreductase subunit beta
VRAEDFINAVAPVWCPGCGDFEVLECLAAALSAAGLATHEVVVVSGIGCSSRLPGYLNTYGFNTIHGRPLPIATGLKLARPDVAVVAVAGDGDAFSIGAGHLLHTARRNPDIAYLVMDNGIYGLTKGQASPTTPLGAATKTTLEGAELPPLNPLELMLSFGTPFVAQAYSADKRGLTELIGQALAFRGFSFVNIVSPCPTFRGGMGVFKELRAMQRRIDPATHDAGDYMAALGLARDAGEMHTGVLYRRGAGADSARLLALGERYR